MKVTIVVYTGVTEEGTFKPGDTPDIREATAEEWIKRGWAIAEPKSEPEPQPEEAQKLEAEPTIEAPEDDMGVPETATLKRKKKR